MERTGLAVEAARFVKRLKDTVISSRVIRGVKITDVRVGKSDSKQLGKTAGRYITFEGVPSDKMMAAVVSRAMDLLLPRQSRILVVGLGNPDVTYDRLGSECIGLIEAGKRICGMIETDVAAKTGIETAQMVRAIATEIKADCVLAIDALTCSDPQMIGKTLQITDTGIAPGSGVRSDAPALTSDYLGIKVVAVGVPMVCRLTAVTKREEHDDFFISCYGEDILTCAWAENIAHSVNMLSG